MIFFTNGPPMGIRDRKEEIMTAQISLQVVVPDFGFAASIGPQAGSGASENRYGKGREMDDRSSPSLIEYFAIGFIAIAVVFGPAIVALL
jgi:hypothetical protein